MTSPQSSIDSAKVLSFHSNHWNTGSPRVRKARSPLFADAQVFTSSSVINSISFAASKQRVFSEALNKPPSGTRSPHSSTAQGRSQAAPGPQRQNKGW